VRVNPNLLHLGARRADENVGAVMSQPIYVGNKQVPQMDNHSVVQGNWLFGIAEIVAGACVIRLAAKPDLNWSGERREGGAKAKLKVTQEHYPLTSKWIPFAAGLYLMFGGATVLAKRVAYVVPNKTETGGGCGCSQNRPQF
jgi:hypothetical protein